MGTIDMEPIHLKIKEGAKPKHSKPYPVPKAFEKLKKKKCLRFCDIGVLEEANHSQWAAPSFIQQKKTGDAQVLTDFCELNKVLILKSYPLPKIQDLPLKMGKLKYATALDLYMGYYHIPLDKYSQNLCTTILPWGKFKYQKLPMGIVLAPDIFQEVTNKLLGDLNYVTVYIDDIIIIQKEDESDESRLEKIEFV